MSKPTDIEIEYNNLVYKVLEIHGGGPEILSLIGSWKDELEDGEIVRYLKEWIEGGDYMTSIENKPVLIVDNSKTKGEE